MTATEPASAALRADHAERTTRTRLWVNWLVALSTFLGAMGVQLFAMGAVMSTAACSSPDCPKPSSAIYGILIYAAPAVAVLTIVVSFFTAPRRRGIVVPLIGWLLLGIDAAILALAFS